MGSALFHGSTIVAQLTTQISTETRRQVQKNKFEFCLQSGATCVTRGAHVAKAIDSLCDSHRDESQREKAKTHPAKNPKWAENGETEKISRQLALGRVPIGKTNLIAWSLK